MCSRWFTWLGSVGPGGPGGPSGSGDPGDQIIEETCDVTPHGGRTEESGNSAVFWLTRNRNSVNLKNGRDGRSQECSACGETLEEGSEPF